MSKPIRFAAVFAALAFPAIAVAAPPSLKLLPQDSVRDCSTDHPCSQPLVDGIVSQLEYADGHQFVLQDYASGGENGKAFVMVSDTSAYPTTRTCNALGNPCRTQTLYLGLVVPKPTGQVAGAVTVWLDALRRDTIAAHAGADKPRDEDRRIAITYDLSVPKVTLVESMGTGTGWTSVATAATWTASTQVSIPASDPNHVHIEMSVVLRPRGTATSEPLTSNKLGLGVRHVRIASPGTVPHGGAGTVPNDAFAPPTDLATPSWLTLDFTNPTPIPMSFATYNVQQMREPIPGGSGSLDPDTIAAIVSQKETVCLSEVWRSGEREDIVESVNALRAQQNLPPMHAVMETTDTVPDIDVDSTGLLLLTTHHVLNSGIHHFSICDDQEIDCPHREGIVWARLALPTAALPAGAPGTIAPTGIDGNEFMDVFCSHVQGGDNTPGDDTDTRNVMFADADHFMRTVRGGGPLPIAVEDDQLPLGVWQNGLDRPAVLLGDLNTPGPHGFIADQPDMPASFPDPTPWQTMLGLLELSNVTAFEASNSMFFDGHDLGITVTGPDPKASGTRLDACAPDMLPILHAMPRVDYVLIIPSETLTELPTFAVGASPAPAVSVDPHFIGGECPSDHAELDVTLNLVRVSDKLKFNPAKPHRARYDVNRLVDHGSGGCCADWYTDKVAMSATGLGSQVNQFLDDETFEGDVVDPNWFVQTGTASLPDLPGGYQGRVSATVRVMEWDEWPGSDDHYDATPEGGTGTTDDDLDQHVSFFAATGDLRRVAGGGALLDVSVDFIGNFHTAGTDQLCLPAVEGASDDDNVVLTTCFSLDEL